jgi:prepilin-type N-terminal cleavage/methylation domain-containing protein
MSRNQTLGFTLIELSIVLVIIGLVVGGILLGEDLIEGARTRAQVSQIEKYQTAFVTFKGKYKGLPGDLVSSKASQFGFAARAGTNGHGDGDGWLESCLDVATLNGSNVFVGCETLLAWRDLAESGLIPGNFSSNTDAMLTASASADADHFPQAAYGSAIDLHVWTTGVVTNPYKYRVSVSLLNIHGAAGGLTGFTAATAFSNFTPLTLFNIDRKIDDGMPCTGKMVTTFPWLPLLSTCNDVTCTTATPEYNIGNDTPYCVPHIQLF